jgi:dihydrofolate reductase
MKPLALVVAVGRNGAIGKDGKLPWRISEDLRHFKRVTLGHAVVMGRKTWDSIGKPLVDRRNLVITSNAALKLEGAEVFTDVHAALEAAHATDDEPRVIGGAEIYRSVLPLATKIFLTEVDRDVEADAFFVFDRSAFRETESRAGEDPTVRYVTLERP